MHLNMRYWILVSLVIIFSVIYLHPHLEFHRFWVKKLSSQLRPIIVLDRHRSLLRLLEKFDHHATLHNIQYRLAFGSLLGFVRDENIISHDSDIDLLIDRSSLATLDLLTLDPQELWYHSNSYQPSLPYFPQNTTMSSIFLHRLTHKLDFASVPRVNCMGKQVKSMVDACSFSGPVSRIISFDQFNSNSNNTFNKQQHHSHPYIDIYLSGCPFHKPYGKYKSWHCRKSTHTCTFCPSGEARTHSLVEQSGGSLSRCRLSGVQTWCPSSKSWSAQYLQKIYGSSWQIKNKRWKYTDRPYNK